MAVRPFGSNLQEFKVSEDSSVCSVTEFDNSLHHSVGFKKRGPKGLVSLI